jgi:hypothetical protein
MEIVIMKDNWEDFKKGNTAYLRALKGEDFEYYSLLHENLVELNVTERNKPALVDDYVNCTSHWLNTAYDCVNLPQKMMLNWLGTVHNLGK